MTEVLSQEEIDQLINAINAGDTDAEPENKTEYGKKILFLENKLAIILKNKKRYLIFTESKKIKPVILQETPIPHSILIEMINESDNNKETKTFTHEDIVYIYNKKTKKQQTMVIGEITPPPGELVEVIFYILGIY